MKHILFFVGVLSTISATSQITFQKTFGGTLGDGGSYVQQTSDGGYIIVGQTETFGAGSRDAYLVKVDAGGAIQWTKTFGGTAFDGCSSVQQTIEGGYIIAGLASGLGAGGQDVYLVKTDASGNLLWSKTYGGINDDVAVGGQQCIDSGYVMF